MKYTLQVSPSPSLKAPRRRRRVVTHASANRPLKVVEAASGKAAIYGVVCSSTNWVLTGANPVQQSHDPSMALLGAACCGLSAYATLRSSELYASDEEFNRSVLLKEGRTAMVIFAFTVLVCL